MEASVITLQTVHIHDVEVIDILSTKMWEDMSPEEQELCMVYVVSHAISEEHLYWLLEDEFGITDCAICWGATKIESSGGLVSQDGSLILINFGDYLFA